MSHIPNTEMIFFPQQILPFLFFSTTKICLSMHRDP